MEFLDLLNFVVFRFREVFEPISCMVIAGEDMTIILLLCRKAQEEFQVAIFRKGLPLSEWKKVCRTKVPSVAVQNSLE